jgi:hypothetical protein
MLPVRASQSLQYANGSSFLNGTTTDTLRFNCLGLVLCSREALKPSRSKHSGFGIRIC